MPMIDGFDQLRHADGSPRRPSKVVNNMGLDNQSLKKTLGLRHADLEGQLDPQDALVLHRFPPSKK